MNESTRFQQIHPHSFCSMGNIQYSYAWNTKSSYPGLPLSFFDEFYLDIAKRFNKKTLLNSSPLKCKPQMYAKHFEFWIWWRNHGFSESDGLVSITFWHRFTENVKPIDQHHWIFDLFQFSSTSVCSVLTAIHIAWTSSSSPTRCPIHSLLLGHKNHKTTAYKM